jgi:hypothetical protein
MRALFAILAFATACSPDVPPGTYLCGPEELCPEGLACDRTTALCESRPKEFACGDNADVPGDDTPATAQTIGELPCSSLVQQRKSCLPLGDTGDFYAFTVGSTCTSARLVANVTFPIAFQNLVLQLAKEGEPPVTMTTACPNNNSDEDGNAAACLSTTIAPGSYVLGVVPDGTGTCDDECRFNRYNMGLQIL